MIVEKIQSKQNPEHWPTLEILPGGVIKYADKYEEDLTCYQNDVESGCSEMMYACAKCPQRFNYLFSLVKHVKLHEIQKKKEQELELISISNYYKHINNYKNILNNKLNKLNFRSRSEYHT